MYNNTFLNISVLNLYIQDKLGENGIRLQYNSYYKSGKFY